MQIFLVCVTSVLDEGLTSDSTLPGGPHVSNHDQLWPFVDTATTSQHYENHPHARRSLETVTYGSSSFSTIRVRIEFIENDPDACQYEGDTYRYTDGGTTYEATCGKDDVLTADKMAYLRGTLLPRAVEYYERHLRVVPVTGSLQFERRCRWTIGGEPCCDTHPSQCSYDATNMCHEAPIGASSYASADFVLFVTARPTQGATIAWATTCRSDQYGRPIAGHANFGPDRISTDALQRNEQVAVATHEIAHALGWSSSKFAQFRDHATGALRGVSNVISTYTQAGKTVQKLTTPAVVQAVREHFGCASLDGAELEDQGGSGTAGSHLEKRVFHDEFMTGTSGADPVYSRISLAVFVA
jgi:hypothetical protein